MRATTKGQSGRLLGNNSEKNRRQKTYPTLSESWGIVMERIYLFDWKYFCWGCPLSGRDEDVFHVTICISVLYLQFSCSIKVMLVISVCPGMCHALSALSMDVS